MNNDHFTKMRETAGQGAWDVRMLLSIDPETRTIDPTELSEEQIRYIQQMHQTGLYQLDDYAHFWHVPRTNVRAILNHCFDPTGWGMLLHDDI